MNELQNNAQAQQSVEQDSTIQQASADTTGENKPAENLEKTFTQSEVNELIKSRLEREHKNMPSKDELVAFKKWQEEQQTTEEKHNNAINAERQKAADAEIRANNFEAKCIAMTKGVKPEAVEDVIALAKVKVGDDVTLEQAIDGIIAKYPAFSGNAPQNNTGVKTGNNKTETDDDVLLKKSMGLL